MKEDLKNRFVTEGQLLFEFIREEPEYVQEYVDRVVRCFVRERLEEKRDQLIGRVDVAIEQAFIRIASQQLFDIAMAEDCPWDGAKSLADEVQAKARLEAVKKFGILMKDMAAQRNELRELRERIERDDSDWWKRGGDSWEDS